MNKKKYNHFFFVLFLVTVLSFNLHAQDDEFNLGDQPTNPGNGTDLTLPDEPSFSEQSPSLPQETAKPSPEKAMPTPPPPEITPEPLLPEPQKKEVAIPETLPQKISRPEPSLATGSSDDPDLKKEERFHTIYKKFNENPTNVEQWEKVIGARASEAYVIQKDDTLWDLSKTLFDDPNYWPKIWSLNKESIYNPHQINPRLHLRFYPGTKTQPPTLGVTEKPVPEVPPEALAKNEGEGPLPVEPPPEIDSTPKPRARIPVLKKIPPSLPEYSVVGIVKPKLTVENKPKKSPSPLMILPYYITDRGLGDVGRIKETEIGAPSAFEFQYVFVEVQDPQQKIYTVIKENPEISLGLLKSASHIEVQGEIEIVNKVNDNSNLYRALVKKTLLRVEVGAKLIPGSIPMVNTALGPEKQAAAATIIGGQFGKSNIIYSTSSFVFLNSGSNQGYQEGDVLPVYATYKNRNEKSSATINERKIGVVKVVKVSDSVSTAYVLNSFEDIQKGDIVGSTVQSGGDVSTVTPEVQNAVDEELEIETPAETPMAPPGEAPAEESLTPEDELTL